MLLDPDCNPNTDADHGVQISLYILEKYKTIQKPSFSYSCFFQNGTLIFVQFKSVKKLQIIKDDFKYFLKNLAF